MSLPKLGQNFETNLDVILAQVNFVNHAISSNTHDGGMKAGWGIPGRGPFKGLLPTSTHF